METLGTTIERLMRLQGHDPAGRPAQRPDDGTLHPHHPAMSLAPAVNALQTERHTHLERLAALEEIARTALEALCWEEKWGGGAYHRNPHVAPSFKDAAGRTAARLQKIA